MPPEEKQNITEDERPQNNALVDLRVKIVFWVATIALTALGAGIVGITIFAGITLNSEKQVLRDMEKEVRSALEKQVNRIDSALQRVEAKPDVMALSRIGEPLDKKIVKATYIGNKIQFTIIIKNTGNKQTDPLFIKWYTREPIKLGDQPAKSSDEPDYDYESISDPYNPSHFPTTMSKILPAQASITFNVEGKVTGIDRTRKSWPVLVKIYYGGEKAFRAAFAVEIPE